MYGNNNVLRYVNKGLRISFFRVLICILDEYYISRVNSLKSQVVYSKQPKLGLTQEFVVDCAHALWVVHSIKRLVSLMLLKWFLSDSFIYFMYRMLNENF